MFVKNGIVCGLNPDVFAGLADTYEFPGVKLTLIQYRPELSVFPAGGLVRTYEHPVVVTDDFVEFISHRREKVPVCVEDRSVCGKLDHGLPAIDGFKPPGRKRTVTINSG